jgi:outer membrane protein assembly factor BamB
MKYRQSFRIIALVAAIALGPPAMAAKFTMGNFDREGSRSIPGGGNLTKKNVLEHGLEVKWTTTTESSVAHSAVTSGNRVMVGDMNGNMYAFDASDGSLIWQTCIEAACGVNGFPFAGVIGNPLVKENKIYVGTLSGSMVALDIQTGAIVWRHTPTVNLPAFGTLPLDAVWGGAIAVNDMIIYGLSPADQFGLGVDARGAVLAVNKDTGAEVWRSILIPDADFEAGSTGAGFWASAPTYSVELGLIYVGTGQDRNPADGVVGSDSIFALDASDGAIVWQTQVRTTDTWNVTLPFNPRAPVDTDFSQSPSVFKLKGMSMVAAGDKRGIFWIMDAQSGEILNNGGAGLDMFAGKLPGPGLTGGFNLDAGFVKQGNDVKHFAVFADQSAALQDVVDRVEPWVGGVCFSTMAPLCPTLPTGSITVITGDGSAEVCRFSVPETEIFSPFHVDGMIIARGAQDGNLYTIDFDDCTLINTLAVPTGPSGGAALSISDGVIYTGGGFFSAPGLTAIGVAN